MNYLKIILMGLALSVLAGCYSSQDKGLVGFSRLKSGMTEGELKKHLGEPKQVEAKGNFIVWTYAEGSVILQQGVVMTWEVGDVRR